ncbi:MAG: hypothetical protein M3O30_15755 [Planctomycetota bacterium]|nr:hypothetical protein [Planctomycetota bacterium]
MKNQEKTAEANAPREKAETPAPADARKPYHAPELTEQGQLERLTAGSGSNNPICYIP